jgi:hypothetical protein
MSDRILDETCNSNFFCVMPRNIAIYVEKSNIEFAILMQNSKNKNKLILFIRQSRIQYKYILNFVISSHSLKRKKSENNHNETEHIF